MVRRITPRFIRNPGQTVWIVRSPITGLIGSPTVIHARMPAVTVIAYVLPVPIVIQIIDARNIITDIVVTGVLPRRIVVIRIVEVGVIAAITAIVLTWIAGAIVIVQDGTCLIWIDARLDCLRAALAGNDKVFTFLDAAGATLSRHLGCTAECRRHRLVLFVDANPIDARLL